MIDLKILSAIQQIDNRFDFRIENSTVKMAEILNYLVPNAIWNDDFNRVAQYLNSPNKKGLLLFGSVGTGKTLITTQIIPYLLLKEFGKKTIWCNARDLFKMYEPRKKSYFDIFTSDKCLSPICVDDFGQEEIVKNYGNNIDAFQEVVRRAYEKKQTLFASTNLSAKEISNRYGDRTLDRLAEMCVIIPFENKQSFRLQNLIKI